MSNSSGFSLVELIVVMTLLGVLMAMMPNGLMKRYDSLSVESKVSGIVHRIQQCSLKAQSLQRPVSLDSPDCPISSTNDMLIRLSKGQPLIFYSDGSSSGEQMQVSAKMEAGQNISSIDTFIIHVDRITSHAEMAVRSDTDAQK